MFRAFVLIAIMAGAATADVENSNPNQMEQNPAQQAGTVPQPQAVTPERKEPLDTAKIQEALLLLQQALNLVKHGCKECGPQLPSSAEQQAPQQQQQPQPPRGLAALNRVKRQFDWSKCWTCGGSKIIPGTAAPIG